tara:strand:- start:82 stop:291 length:210 start_codon:yes stop_codon:yes gene_type:complete
MINGKKLFKYLIMLLIVTFSTFFIPNCSIINEHAIYVGLLAATTYAILDQCVPNIVVIEESNDDQNINM